MIIFFFLKKIIDQLKKTTYQSELNTYKYLITRNLNKKKQEFDTNFTIPSTILFFLFSLSLFNYNGTYTICFLLMILEKKNLIYHFYSI